jgi:hypothetical protein
LRSHRFSSRCDKAGAGRTTIHILNVCQRPVDCNQICCLPASQNLNQWRIPHSLQRLPNIFEADGSNPIRVAARYTVNIGAPVGSEIQNLRRHYLFPL